jgi:hypothetical protein
MKRLVILVILWFYEEETGCENINRLVLTSPLEESLWIAVNQTHDDDAHEPINKDFFHTYFWSFQKLYYEVCS